MLTPKRLSTNAPPQSAPSMTSSEYSAIRRASKARSSCPRSAVTWLKISAEPTGFTIENSAESASRKLCTAPFIFCLSPLAGAKPRPTLAETRQRKRANARLMGKIFIFVLETFYGHRS